MAIKDTNAIRIAILELVHKAKEGHIPSSFSVVEILFALYAGMKPDDKFFLSKGHASAGLYATLNHFGLLSDTELARYCSYESKLGGHPHRDPPRVINSSGSLGHGFPIAVGYALGKRISKEQGKVFCLIGDGEANEGSVWEAALYGDFLKLGNIVCIVDDNNSQTRAVPSPRIAEKFRAFGWRVHEIDGHDLDAIQDALFTNPEPGPYCVVAKTVKGKGIKVMEHNVEWHHKAPTEEELAEFKKELLA